MAEAILGRIIERGREVGVLQWCWAPEGPAPVGMACLHPGLHLHPSGPAQDQLRGWGAQEGRAWAR